MIKSISGALAHKRSELGQKEKGFTLIELLVVVIIIGVLAAIAIPIFLGQQASARDGAVKSDITNAKVAVVASMVKNNGAIPTDLTTLPDFAAAGTSNLTIRAVAATSTVPAGFCIQGFDTTNTVSSAFKATDKTGVATGTC